MKKLMLSAFVAAGFATLLTGAEPERRYVMVNEKGEYNPSNVVVTSEQIKRIEGHIDDVNRTAADANKAVSNATEEVNTVVAGLVGNTAVVYVDGFIESIGGVIDVDTNLCAATIFDFVKDGGGEQTIDGVLYKGHQIYFAYPEDVHEAVSPAIRYQYNLGGTNTWLYAEQDDPIGPSTIEAHGRKYENAYLSVAWLPAELSQAFFKVFTKIIESGGGMSINIYGGLRGYYTGKIEIREPTDIKLGGGLIMGWQKVKRYDEPWDFANSPLVDAYEEGSTFDIRPYKYGSQWRVALYVTAPSGATTVRGFYEKAVEEEGETYYEPVTFAKSYYANDATYFITQIAIGYTDKDGAEAHATLYREGFAPEP